MKLKSTFKFASDGEHFRHLVAQGTGKTVAWPEIRQDFTATGASISTPEIS
jgi:hypothetical protein